MEWQDNTKNDRLTPGTFRDGVAIGLPLGDAPAFFAWANSTTTSIFGTGRPIGRAISTGGPPEAPKSSAEGVRTFEVIPRRVSSVEDLIGGGFSTLTTKEKQGRVQGKATWKDGVWHVVMRRPSAHEEQDNEAKLIPGRVQTVSFAVWNGENKERNGQKAVAPWFQLSLIRLRKSRFHGRMNEKPSRG